MGIKKDFLNIAIIQTDIYWMNTSANLAMLEEKIWEISSKPDLIILPEMFNTGFSKDVIKYAEHPKLTTFKWMQQQAMQTKAVITGSFAVKEGNNFYNRLLWVRPDGSYEYYDKKHLFSFAEENLYFSAGNKQLSVTVKGWVINPFICYDLRFPVWSRNTPLHYDVAIYVANWPTSRINAWDTLLKARAIENLSYTIGVNRIGTDGNQLDYNGHSAVYSPKGETIQFNENEDTIICCSLSLNELNQFRGKFQAHLDADKFNLQN